MTFQAWKMKFLNSMTFQVFHDLYEPCLTSISKSWTTSLWILLTCYFQMDAQGFAQKGLNRYLNISPNTPCLPPKFYISIVFWFLSGPLSCPKEIKDNRHDLSDVGKKKKSFSPHWDTVNFVLMTTNLLHDYVTFYFVMLVVASMKVTNQPMKCDLFPVAIMSFRLHSCLHHWSHWSSVPPCSREIATLILISKGFAWITVVEQQWGY